MGERAAGVRSGHITKKAIKDRSKPSPSGRLCAIEDTSVLRRWDLTERACRNGSMTEKANNCIEGEPITRTGPHQIQISCQAPNGRSPEASSAPATTLQQALHRISDLPSPGASYYLYPIKHAITHALARTASSETHSLRGGKGKKWPDSDYDDKIYYCTSPPSAPLLHHSSPLPLLVSLHPSQIIRVSPSYSSANPV